MKNVSAARLIAALRIALIDGVYFIVFLCAWAGLIDVARKCCVIDCGGEDCFDLLIVILCDWAGVVVRCSM
jgi:hypothetical protein